MNTPHPLFNDRLRQVLMVLLLIALLLLFLNQLSFLAPGFLGAVTLYILSSDQYTRLTVEKKWRKSGAASLFLTLFTLCIGLPVYFSVYLIIPHLKNFFDNPDAIIKKAEMLSSGIRRYVGFDVLSSENTKAIIAKLGNMIPDLLNNSALVFGNFVLILFLAYFMLTEKEKMEKAISGFIPLKPHNIELLEKETRNLVKANAIGIPLISIIQGCFAIFGYWIFGVENFVLWGFLTGVFSFFPVVGTALIWVPLCINQFSHSIDWQSVGLLLYTIIVLTNVDYLARISILKRIGHVHPVITIIGVILGLKLFGFWGFIFGPLLVSYLLLLLKIYTSEFGTMYNGQQPRQHTERK